MTAPEHYRKAEELVDMGRDAAALVHAVVALAAAVGGVLAVQFPPPPCTCPDHMRDHR